MIDENIHTEKITSNKTSALFLSLTGLFLILFIWRRVVSGMNGLTIVLLCFFVFFLFCSINYRILNISLTRKELALKFGLVTWVIPLGNIASCRLDEIPWLMKNGGAGIHFMFIQGRYRASFNFLEYSRVVISLKRRMGPVRDISFTTRRPEDLIRSIRDLTSSTWLVGEK